MMKKYSFAALKYIHDVASFECLNVGVVIFSAEQKTILCKFSRPYSRLSNTFSGFDHKHYYQLVSRIETQINNKNKEFSLEFEFGPTPKLREILNNILPVDDSSLKFFDIGGGITDDLNKTLESLFVRYVEKYTKSPKRFRREDEEVWTSFKSKFEERGVFAKLTSHTLYGKYFEFEFSYAWKNGVWNIEEPISFDYMDPKAILDTANKWVGRITNLLDGEERFHLNLLTGKPQDTALMSNYLKAEKMLSRFEGTVKIIHEEDADSHALQINQYLSGMEEL